MKETKIIKKDDIENKGMNNQKKVLVLSILCMVILLISSSYALMTNFSQKEDAITFTTGNLEMTILNGEETFSLINLNNRLPESDQSGIEKSTVIPITLKNTGTIVIGSYDVKLVNDEEEVSTLSDEYIRFSVSEDNITYSNPATLTDNDNIIYQGEDLDVNHTKTIYLKIWIGENSGNRGLNKTYYADLEIKLKQQQTYNTSSIIDIKDAGSGKITFTAVDNGNGVSEYCVNQNQEDTTDCIWYEAIVGEQTTSKLVEENGNYYVHLKDLKGNIGHSDVVVMDVNLTAEMFIQEKYGIGGLIAVNTDGTLYSGTGTIREYRYSGASVNNYVFFDTDGDSVQDDNEMWRIIGVFKNSNGEWNLKIIRNIVLTSSELPSTYTYGSTSFTIENGTTGQVYWNSTKIGTNYNDWTKSGLQYYLNGTDGYFGTLSSGAQDVVDANYTYYLGNFKHDASTTISGYDDERNAENIWSGNQISINNAVSLIYSSDYGYSASSSYWESPLLYNYDGAAYKTSWMQTTATRDLVEWILPPSSYASDCATRWDTTGYVRSGSKTTVSYAIRPTLNFLSTVRLEDATGEESNPYKIIIE